MPLDLQGRTQYLELAFFCQNVISALLDYVDQDKEDKLQSSLKEALSSLEVVSSGDLGRLVVERVAAFASYEQLRTLKEVWGLEERKDADRMLREVLNASSRRAAKKAAAERLIDLFSKLQNQALWRFEQPETSLSFRAFRDLWCTP